MPIDYNYVLTILAAILAYALIRVFWTRFRSGSAARSLVAVQIAFIAVLTLAFFIVFRLNQETENFSSAAADTFNLGDIKLMAFALVVIIAAMLVYLFKTRR